MPTHVTERWGVGGWLAWKCFAIANSSPVVKPRAGRKTQVCVHTARLSSPPFPLAGVPARPQGHSWPQRDSVWGGRRRGNSCGPANVPARVPALLPPARAQPGSSWSTHGPALCCLITSYCWKANGQGWPRLRGVALGSPMSKPWPGSVALWVSQRLWAPAFILAEKHLDNTLKDLWGTVTAVFHEHFSRGSRQVSGRNWRNSMKMCCSPVTLKGTCMRGHDPTSLGHLLPPKRPLGDLSWVLSSGL